MGLMRLGIDASAARTGGGASRVNELAHTLAALAPEREYIFILNPALAPRVQGLPPRMRIMVVPSILRTAPLRALWEHLYLPPTLRRQHVDWILSPFNVLPLGPGFGNAVRKAVIVSSVLPLAPDMWGDLSRYQIARLKALRALTLHSVSVADRVFLLSREAQRRLQGRVPEDKVAFLPMAPPSPSVVEASRRASLPDTPHGVPFFVVAGDLIPYKGFEDAIRAVNRLASDGVDIQLLICGNPIHVSYSRRLHEVAREGTPGAVIFLSGLTQAQVLALMTASVGTIVCSRFENTSRVPVEAMSVGSPLISADVRIARETCGDAAAYYSAGNSAELAAQMSILLSAPAVRHDLSSRGARRLNGTDWLVATRMILRALEQT
jgi:glycosyltransferase involved in cell wall biosynthesis